MSEYHDERHGVFSWVCDGFGENRRWVIRMDTWNNGETVAKILNSETAALHQRIAELEAENERLREFAQIVHYGDWTSDMRSYFLEKNDGKHYAIVSLMIDELNGVPTTADDVNEPKLQDLW